MAHSTSDTHQSEPINQKALKFLYVFDFDHTIIEDNSDTAITSVLPTPLPKEIEDTYDGTNWTELMDKVMTFIASQGVEVTRIEERLKEMPFAAGMKSLLDRIVTTVQTTGLHRLLIVSDANDFFIKTILSHGDPPVTPNEVITNVTLVENNVVRVLPYENQTSCPLCPKNLCKGAALEKYIENEGPFDTVYYTGDGQNDLCPGLRLSDRDFLFVRTGFGLEKVIKSGQLKGLTVKVQATTVFYDNGAQIEEIMRF